MGRISLTVAGSMADGSYHQAVACARYLQDTVEDFKVEIIPLTPTDWEAYKVEQQNRLQGRSFQHRKSPMVHYHHLGQEWYLGDAGDMLKWAGEKFGYHDNTKMQVYNRLGSTSWDTYLSKSGRFVYFELVTEQDPASKVGQLIIELFDEECPKTCENFRQLCAGTAGAGKKTGALHYLKSPIHRVLKNGWIQGGDIVKGRGNDGESIYGDTFPDESYHYKHTGPGLVGMSQSKKHANSSQFYITLAPMPSLDNNRVVFGKVVNGLRTLRLIEKIETKNERPVDEIIIGNCGIWKSQVEYAEERRAAKALEPKIPEPEPEPVYEMNKEDEGEGHAYLWGEDIFAQLGHDKIRRYYNTPEVLKFSDKKSIAQISCGVQHTAMLLASGILYTWGVGRQGQLGHGTFDSMPYPTLLEMFYDAKLEIKSVSCGGYHTVALCAHHKMWTFGAGEDGELGHGAFESYEESQTSPRPVMALEGIEVRSVAAGMSMTACTTAEGHVYTCGKNSSGRLGHGDDVPRHHTPKHLESLSSKHIVKVAVPVVGNHMLCLTDSGVVFSWGASEHGQLGIGPMDENKKTFVDPITKETYIKNPMKAVFEEGVTISDVSTCNKITAFLDSNGKILVCGAGGRGELGHVADTFIKEEEEPVEGEEEEEDAPAPVEEVRTSNIDNPDDQNSQGSAAGDPVEGEADPDQPEPEPEEEKGEWVRAPPAKVWTPCRIKENTFVHEDSPEEQPIKQIVCGVDFMAALTEDGNVFSWGDNSTHSLGHALSTREIRVQKEMEELAAAEEEEEKAAQQVESVVSTPRSDNTETPPEPEPEQDAAEEDANGEQVEVDSNGDPIEPKPELRVVEPDEEYDGEMYPREVESLHGHGIEHICAGYGYVATVSKWTVEGYFASLKDVSGTNLEVTVSKFRRELILKLFEALDDDASGFITIEEIYPLAQKLQPNVTYSKVVEGLLYIDSSGDFKINFPEFMAWFAGFTSTLLDEEFENGVNYLVDHVNDPPPLPESAECRIVRFKGPWKLRGAGDDSAEELCCSLIMDINTRKIFDCFIGGQEATGTLTDDGRLELKSGSCFFYGKWSYGTKLWKGKWKTESRKGIFDLSEVDDECKEADEECIGTLENVDEIHGPV